MKKAIKFLKKNSFMVTILGLTLLIFLLGWKMFSFTKSLIFTVALALILVGIEVFTDKKYLQNFKKTIQGKVNKEKKPVTTTGKKKSKNKKKKILKIVLLICLSFGILGIMAVGALFIYIAKSAPNFDPDALYRVEASVIYYENKEVMAKLGREKREKIGYNDLSEELINAVIATEDSRFFQHNGVDLPRFLKATLGQLAGNSGAGGGSTITMQISKNSYTSRTASGFEGIKRKLTDIYLSMFKIEKKYTKQEILEYYVNDSYLGSGSYGVEQACQTYFGKSAKDINVAEAALIAGLFQAPDAYDPMLYPEKAEGRRKTVIYLMRRHGYITAEEEKIAREMTVDKLLVKNSAVASTNEYQGFINTVVDEVRKLTGDNPYDVPMEIYTTMNKEKQDAINKVYKEYKFVDSAADTGIILTNIHTGEILAVGAGRSVVVRGFNFATMTDKQIGSTAKIPYDYGPAFEYNGWSTYTPLADEQHAYSDGVSIKNYDGAFKGLVTTRYAIEDSRNIPALKTFQSLNNKKILDFVTSLGLSPEVSGGKLHEAHAIGGYTGESPMTLNAAYSAFGNGGYYVEPHSFTKLIYRENGEVYEREVKKEQVMSKETAYMISDMLLTTTKQRFTKYMSLTGISLATKTGTTNFDSATIKAYKLVGNAINDLWLTGYTPDYGLTVWYGYKELDPEHPEYVTKFGSNEHRKIYAAVAKTVLPRDNKTFKKPDKVIEVEIESGTVPAQLPSQYTPASLRVKELFKQGTEPTDVSNRFNTLNNVTNLQSTVNGNKVTLTWTPIATPDAIDKDKLTNYFNKIFNSEGFRTKYLNDRLSYNNSNMGTIIYNVYIKNDSGLQLIGSTPNTKIEHTISTNKAITYVVKTSYTIFKANISTGAEHTINFDPNATIVTINLNGNSSVQVKQNEAYIENTPSVIVLENLVPVSTGVNIVTTITDQNGNPATINSSTIGAKFTITYEVTYKDYSETLTRTVTIVAN